MMSSAVIGGFLLGMSYKKYGRDIKQRLQKMSRRQVDYDDYMTSHEPDA
jgi:hypothetical protein